MNATKNAPEPLRLSCKARCTSRGFSTRLVIRNRTRSVWKRERVALVRANSPEGNPRASGFLRCTIHITKRVHELPALASPPDGVRRVSVLMRHVPSYYLNLAQINGRETAQKRIVVRDSCQFGDQTECISRFMRPLSARQNEEKRFARSPSA